MFKWLKKILWPGNSPLEEPLVLNKIYKEITPAKAKKKPAAKKAAPKKRGRPATTKK